LSIISRLKSAEQNGNTPLSNQCRAIRRVARVGQFRQLNQKFPGSEVFMCKPNYYFSARSTKCLGTYPTSVCSRTSSKQYVLPIVHD